MLRWSLVCLAGGLSFSLAPLSQAGAPRYALVGSFTTPQGSGARTIAADGRLLTLVGNEVHLQQSAGSSSFAMIGSIDPSLLNSFGASFVAANPDGSLLAIGDGNFGPGANVHLLEWSSLDTMSPSAVTSVEAASYEAHWANDGRLFVSGADFSDTFVSVIERAGSDTPTVRRVVEGIGGASGGVTVRDGVLFTSNGFDFDPGTGSMTGDVRAFDLDTITRGASPANFESEGVLAASALSGLSLGFDAVGNLIVGGGDFANPAQFGFASIVDAGAVQAALAGLGPASDSDEQWLSPAGANTYSAVFDAFTGEVLIWGFADGMVYRYAIPAPGGALLVMSGIAAFGRRRRD